MRKHWIALVLVLLTGCGGGGGGGNAAPQEPELLAATRYFPSRIGSRYTYHLATLQLPFLPGEDEDLTYDVEPQLGGTRQYYNLQDTDGATSGPKFDGLLMLGCDEEIAGFTTPEMDFVSAKPEVLPATLSGLGQVWFTNVTARRDNGRLFELQGSSLLAAVEDLALGGSTFQDCLRVDVQFSYRFFRGVGTLPALDIPLVTGSYWLAPDIGPVRGVARVAGVTVGEVRLVSAFTL